MNIVILAPVRLLGESLAVCLAGHCGIERVEIAATSTAVRALLGQHIFDVVLVDISRVSDSQDMRALACEWPQVRLLALGLEEQRDAVIRCGRAGFAGYVPRDASLEALRNAVLDCSGGRLRCPAEIAGEMMRALFSGDAQPAQDAPQTSALTNRQEQVIELIGRGYSNKEIARELDLSVATVKHHVHHILAKLQVERRTHVIRRFRESLRTSKELPSESQRR